MSQDPGDGIWGPPRREPPRFSQQHHAAQHQQRPRRPSHPDPLLQQNLRQHRLQDELAAEAGTAKLRGAVCTSAMKAKNETARDTIENSSQRRATTRCSIRA